ncbi:crotonyl-CoA carboxylase/reductase [Cryptosporangium japonicum]|uniref:Crotonyl-CoA carboxylase/reductase n=1 Tax=Cryptosporangium japonicum TaxID=80872 RepID=A0ABN0TJY8_9ACTN
MSALADAVTNGADARLLAALPLPERYRALYLRKEDADMFAGVEDKDVSASLRVGSVVMPALAPDEVLVAVMASSINYNTVWSAIFEPTPTFRFLERLAATGGWAARHDLPHHVVGSDASGVIVRVGAGVRRWHVGDHVVVSPVQADDQDPATHEDGMLGVDQRIWGFETNFGGLADFAVVRASQLVGKPAHLTWEEAACNPLCAGTAYRMLVGEHGARIKQGDAVLIWGAAGGLGAYAVQLVRNGGGIPIGVVSSDARADAIRRLGCDLVVKRSDIGLSDDVPGPDEVRAIGRRLGSIIRGHLGRDPDVVFEHVGRATFGISVFVLKRGGTVVTCGSSTGYHHEFDNRYLWMKLKRVIGSHAANLQEQWECARLFESGALVPTLSEVFPLSEAPKAARQVQTNRHAGKVGITCLAPTPGLGVTDPALRARIGADRLNPFRVAAAVTA